MKKISFDKFVNCSLTIYFFLMGVLFLVLSLVYERADGTTDDKKGIVLLLVAYFMFLLGFVYSEYINHEENKKFKDISMAGFVNWCLFYPTSLGMLILVINYFVNFTSFEIIVMAIFILQFVIIAIWHIAKLRNTNLQYLKESDLLKMDFYSTFAILFLTLIWVLYDVNKIILVFAIAMLEFLLIQLKIKHIIIKNKIKEESEKKNS